MTVIVALIGAKALYLMFIWLASAIVGSWLSARAGFGEKPGLATGLLLTFVGAAIWLVIYLFLPRPGSRRAVEGIIPKRREPGAGVHAG
jgi:threonine/homoserine efflux transporter RhtA